MPHSDGTQLALERLIALCDQLASASDSADSPHAITKPALEELCDQLAGDADSALGAAVRRLFSIAELWECLAAEEPSAAADMAPFFVSMLEILIAGLSQGTPDEAITRLLSESEDRWGEYLVLLDPALQQAPAADSWDSPYESPEIADDEPAFDAAALLRQLSGLAESESPVVTAAEPPRAEPVAAAKVAVAKQVVAGTPHTPPPPETVSSASNLEDELRELKRDAGLREAFLADALDLFSKIQDLALGLGGSDDRSRLQGLGRCYHTLKGAAGSVGLITLADQIHALEDELEQAESQASDSLIRELEASLAQIERVLSALEAKPVASAPTPMVVVPVPTPEPAARQESQDRSDGDGLIRIPAQRFEELIDLCSELLTLKGAWADRAGRMKQFANTARTCGQRLRGNVEQLGDAAAKQVRGASVRTPIRSEERSFLLRQMTEQCEDLAALADTAREAALPMADDAETLSRLSLRLWDSLQSVRLVKVRGLFQRLARAIREAARIEQRQVETVLLGDHTDADRLLLDKVYEPLLHVVRNAVGHGIEPADERVRVGKLPAGRVLLEAKRDGNTLVISVQDDGKGLDHAAILGKGRRLGLIGSDEQPSTERLNSLIFQPGFSTRAEANALSGRGVGMDVVAREVQQLRGTIELTSLPGQGTRLAIRLPARLSLEHVMVVRLSGQAFAIPSSNIDSVHREAIVVPERDGQAVTVVINGRRLPLVDARMILGHAEPPAHLYPTFLVVTSGTDTVAARVDSVDGPSELVIRPLEPLLAGHPAVSGTSLTTGGEPILALDVAGLLRLARKQSSTSRNGGPNAARPRVLVVDDSLSVRRVAKRNLRALGLEVDEADDGEQALGKIRMRPYRLIMTDLEMPRMDGFALLAELGRTGVLESTSVVVASTLSDPATRRRVEKLGAHRLLAKPVVADELARVVGELLIRDVSPTVASC
jgi:chemotaxis protein histidine kinase CheA/ActR/RegA family two-component response regulator